MKVGLIPPIPHLDRYGQGDFHLVLSHLLEASPEYRQHYRRQGIEQGAFIVLDNSAHELTVGQRPELLLQQAIDIGASEIVCPDALFDDVLTVSRTSEALKFYERRSRTLDRFNLSLMMVPQAVTPEAWGSCLKSLAWTFEQIFPMRSFTIGVSKDYEIWDCGIDGLIEKYVLPLVTGYHRPISVHLLGWGRQLRELKMLGKKYPWIRSTDSAKPFVYAASNIEVPDEGDVPTYPTRSKTYFTDTLTDEQLEIADSNIALFQSYANP